MAKPYSLDLRERVVAYVENGHSCKEASVVFDVSIASAVRWAARAKAEGSPAAMPMGGQRRDALAGDREWLLAQVERKPDLTLHALLAQLERRGTKICCDTLWRFLCREGIRFKKNRVRRGTDEEQNRPDVKRRRASWSRHVLGRVDPARLVFIDETWVKTNMIRTHGWHRRGEPLKTHAPHGHWRTMTFLAALRHDRITAPFVFDGAINGKIFETYVEKVLVPTLQSGDIVVLDNLGSHKGTRVRQLIHDADARIWFLPPYSPDFNPIEQMFSKVKRLLRKANERTFERIWHRLGKLIRKIPPAECARYIKNSGYSAT